MSRLSGFGKSLVDNDLRLGTGTLLQEAGSFSSWAGFSRTTLSSNADVRVTTWGNRVISGPSKGQYLVRGTSQNPHARRLVMNTSELAMAHGKKANLWNRGRYALGGRGGFGLLGGYFMYGNYKDSRQEGHGVLGSAGRAVGQSAKEIAAFKMARIAFSNPYTAIPAAAGLAAGAVFMAKDSGNKYLRQRRVSEMNGSGEMNAAFQTRQAYTMRQRALNSIGESRFNVGRALGNEASFRTRRRMPINHVG